MLKKLSALTLSLIFVLGIAGLALAGNTSTVDQTGLDNEATVVQDGDLNVASIEQISNDSNATQDQNGSNNTADLDQKGGWPADSTVVNETGSQTQDGALNFAQLWQLSDAGFGGNIGNQNQNGTDNIVIAWQFTITSTVDQDQSGLSNQARIYQVGLSNYAKQDQDGENNWANIDEQAGGWSAGNTAEQTQEGKRNKSLIAQYGALGNGDKTADGNTALVTQNGDDNWAGEGYNNGGLFGIFQAGDYNEAEITQDGDENEASIYQYGNLNDASIDQDGNNNVATVTQTP